MPIICQHRQLNEWHTPLYQLSDDMMTWLFKLAIPFNLKLSLFNVVVVVVVVQEQYLHLIKKSCQIKFLLSHQIYDSFLA